MNVRTGARLGALLLAACALSACSSREDEYFDACMGSPDAGKLANAQAVCQCMADKSKAMTDDDYELMKLGMAGNEAEMNAKMSSWTFDQRAGFAQRQLGMLECIDPSMMKIE
jgi:hypothetical protein